MAQFHAMIKLKKIAQEKILMSQILIQKRATNKPTTKIAHFFNCRNDHHLGDAINFDYVSPSPRPPYTFKNYEWRFVP